MQHIRKLKLTNFKRFQQLEMAFDEGINTIIGDNESGKSSILQAIDLVSKASRTRVETIGIESLLNKEACQKFINLPNKDFSDLPEAHIEVFLHDDSNCDITGKHNTSSINSAGLHMSISPDDALTQEINDVIIQNPDSFPYEFYLVRFFTFSGEGYSSYSRYLSTLTIDSSQISSEYANKEYTKTVYQSTVQPVERVQLRNKYRQHKDAFTSNDLASLNQSLQGDYSFALRSNSKLNLETEIGLVQQNIPIDERGKGQQCFIKTEFVLSKNSNKKLDTLLLEEPENHLSHANMKRLISRISESDQNQIIITTHNSLISSRLSLKKSILLNSTSENVGTLKDIPKETAKFFMKAPDSNVLEFVLSSKVILVEGDAEYMLMETFYKSVNKEFEQDNVHIISVDGLSFKRYLDLAKVLNIKVSVVRDNDGDFHTNCIDNYEDYSNENIKIFYDSDNERNTFEVCVYQDNKDFCDELFNNGKIKKTPQEFMLDNKAESAFRIAEKCEDDNVSLNVPQYIKDAIEWINE